MTTAPFTPLYGCPICRAALYKQDGVWHEAFGLSKDATHRHQPSHPVELLGQPLFKVQAMWLALHEDEVDTQGQLQACEVELARRWVTAQTPGRTAAYRTRLTAAWLRGFRRVPPTRGDLANMSNFHRHQHRAYCAGQLTRGEMEDPDA